MPDINSTNHGLCVLTNAPARQRLQRPVSTDCELSTTFNDATSGGYYDHSSGHEGIDFACAVDTRCMPCTAGWSLRS